MKKFICKVCGYIHKDEAPPEHCPICFVGSAMFVEDDNEDEEDSAKKFKEERK